jgi:hypothetical protein
MSRLETQASAPESVRRELEPLLPMRLLVLDLFGAVLLGIGAARHFAGVELLPEELRFEGYAMTFIIGGMLLMAPLVFHLIGVLRARQEATRRR